MPVYDDAIRRATGVWSSLFPQESQTPHNRFTSFLGYLGGGRTEPLSQFFPDYDPRVGMSSLFPDYGSRKGMSELSPLYGSQGGMRSLFPTGDLGGSLRDLFPDYGIGARLESLFPAISPFHRSSRPAAQTGNQASSTSSSAPAVNSDIQSVQPGPTGYAFPVVNYSGQVVMHWSQDTGGSDLFAPLGTPVVAARGGHVISAGYDDVGGNYVLIQGDDGLKYYYAHLKDAPSVKTGQQVRAGARIGSVGDTGNAKGVGPHLHIGIGHTILPGANAQGGMGRGGVNAIELLRAVLAGRPIPGLVTPKEMASH
ncbi:MAG: M23 family metallopeptidase [Sphingomonadaceae bacterium]